MRFTSPAHVSLQDVALHPLVFSGEHGERFTLSVLEDDLIRVQFLPAGSPRLDRTWLVVGSEGDTPHAGRLRSDLAPFSQPDFTPEAGAEAIHIHTAQLRLTVRPGDFRLTWADAAGREFAADNRTNAYAYDRAGSAVYHYLVSREGEHYYGFGERSGPLDKRGRRMRMHNLDALSYNAETTDPLYKHFPFYITYVPEYDIAYGLLYDNLASSVFDMGSEHDAYKGIFRYYMAEGGDLDYYFIYGPSIAAVVEKLARLTGRPALPPRWSLGYLGSTMKYTEAPDAQAQLKQFVDLCTEHDIPCDMFHLSSGYTTNADGLRCVFTWNRSRVPDPHAMTDHFHRGGIKVMANIKPYLLRVHPYYDAVAAQGGFVRQAEDDAPEIAYFWSGGVLEVGAGSYVDFTAAAGFAWWKARVKDALLDFGVDAIWNDNNEMQMWDDAARCDGRGQPIPIGLARPLQTLLMGRASYEAMQEHKPGQRPYLVTRSACPGVQRYAQTWSGDNVTSWHTLRWNIPMGLGLSLSGLPNCGHDVGGFDGPPPGPELFVRWVQNGIFHPRFTIHSWNTDRSVNEPWMHPEVLPVIREAIRFRYRLIPYLYSLLFESAQTGRPIIRPLVYHFPHDPRCRTESFDFMLGPHLLVASVLEDGVRTRTVYLPQGVDWYDFYSGERHPGGQTITADAPLERIPLFVAAGGMIPLGKPMKHVGAEADDRREVYVFPPTGSGSSAFTLYEDDGSSTGYRHGEYSAVALLVETTADTITLGVEVPQWGYALPYDRITFILPPGDHRPVHAPGGARPHIVDTGWRYITVSLP